LYLDLILFFSGIEQNSFGSQRCTIRWRLHGARVRQTRANTFARVDAALVFIRKCSQWNINTN